MPVCTCSQWPISTRRHSTVWPATWLNGPLSARLPLGTGAVPEAKCPAGNDKIGTVSGLIEGNEPLVEGGFRLLQQRGSGCGVSDELPVRRGVGDEIAGGRECG
jgi:hypothetical protein